MAATRCRCGQTAPPRRCCQPILEFRRPPASPRALLRARFVALATLDREFVERLGGGWPAWAEDFDDWVSVEVTEEDGAGDDSTDNGGVAWSVRTEVDGTSVQERVVCARAPAADGGWRVVRSERVDPDT